MGKDATTDFFISYARADRARGAWIAWQLEACGYAVTLPDFRPGENVVLRLHQAVQGAARTIVLLSPDYFAASEQQAAWAAAFAQDPASKNGRLLPVRVRDCAPPGLFASLQYIDLVGRDEAAARTELEAGLLAALATSLPAPAGSPPDFPAQAASTRAPTEAPPAFPARWPEIWNVPYQRNPFFTGRETLLAHLHDQLFVKGAAALSQPQAISGLGGIGKTQSAIEFAYRHGHEYRYVLWALADSAENLYSAYAAIAALVKAPGYDERDQRSAVPAIKNWLAQHENWLLILDNADDIKMAADFLPSAARLPGHVLLTTRAQATGAIAHRLAVEKMARREGEELLLKRSKARERGSGRIGKAERSAAAAIVAELDGLPLALAQAGAYIEENDCSLAAYLRLYQQHRKELLAWRSDLARDYPASVATTWALAFGRIEQEHPAAADLLRLCAFLAPDAIPEEIISEGAEYLSADLALVAASELTLNAAIQLLLRYSLAQRDAAAKTLTLHRLVQAVIQDSLDAAARQLWAERAVEALNDAFSFQNYETVAAFERFLPHALACAAWIERYKLASNTAGRLLNQAGLYLNRYARYAEAEALLKQALEITRRVFGAGHRNTGVTLHNLACLYMDQQRYDEAGALFQEVLHSYEQDPEVMSRPGYRASYLARALQSLANLNLRQRRYTEARGYFERALRIEQEDLGAEHPDTATTLSNLGLLYYEQGDERRAEALWREALAIYERGRELGALPADIAVAQYNLAVLYQEQGRYEEAGALYKQALRNNEEALGAKHPETIKTLRSYARLLRAMGREREAAALEARSNVL